ncbi:MAG: tetratricopeptide repeat protein [Ferruginibacter sp.]
MPEEKIIEQLLIEARQYVLNKNYYDASDNFENVLTYQPDNHSAKLELLDALMKWGNELVTIYQNDNGNRIFEITRAIPARNSYLKSLILIDRFPREINKAGDYSRGPVEIDKTIALVYFEIGNVHFYKEDYDNAIELYRKALLHDSANHHFLQSLKLAFREKGEIDKAIEYFDKAISGDPSNPELYNDLGDLYLEDKKDVDQAIEQYKKSLVHDLNNYHTLNLLRLAFKEKGEVDKAIEYYDKSIIDDPENIMLYSGLGNLYLQDKKDYDKAIVQYESALKIDPKNPKVLYLLMKAFREKGELDKGIEYYDKAIAADPDNVDLINDLGIVYSVDKKDYDKAIEQFKKAIEIDKNFAFAFRNLGFVYSEKGETGKAIDNFEKAKAADPLNPKLYRDLGRVYFEDIKDYDKAIQQYTKALEMEPENSDAMYFLRKAFREKGEIDIVIGYFEKSIMNDPDNFHLYYVLGDIFFEDKKDYERAIKQYEKATEIGKDYAYSYVKVALVYKAKGEIDTAIGYYEKAISADPVNPYPYNDLGDIYLKDKKYYDKAIEHYKMAFDHDPGNSIVLKSLEQGFRKKAEIDKGIEFLEKALASGKTYPAIYHALGNFYLKDKWDHNKAIELYKKALEQDLQNYTFLDSIRQAFGKKEEIDKAIGYYEKALAAYPNDPELYNELGRVYFEDKKDYNKAIEQVKKAIQIKKNYVAGFSNISLGYIKLNDFIKAQEYSDQALKIDNKNFFARLNAAVAHDQLQEKDSAEQQYLKLTELNPGESLSYTHLGLFYQSIYKFEKAEENFNTAIEIQSKIQGDDFDKVRLSDTFSDLANLYLDKFEFDQSLKQFDMAFKTDPSNVFALLSKAWIYEKRIQHKEAEKYWLEANAFYTNYNEDVKNKKAVKIADKYFYWAVILNEYISIADAGVGQNYGTIKLNLENAIRLDPDRTYYHLYLLKFYVKQRSILENKPPNVYQEDIKSELADNNRKLMEVYVKGVELLRKKLKKQMNKILHVELGEFYLVGNLYQEAIHEFEEALNLDKEYTQAYIALGVARSKTEDHVEAVKCFKKAIFLDPFDLNIQSNLGDAYLKTENLLLAEETYKKILQMHPLHRDGLLGLGEFYKTAADKMLEDGNQNDAEVYFNMAIEKYELLLNSPKPEDDLGGLYYSIGYIKVKLFEMKRGLKQSLKKTFGSSYLEAKKVFEKILPSQSNYHKAATAINRINKKNAPFMQKKNYAAFFIPALSFFVFLLTQYLFLKGRPTDKDVFFINKPALQKFISENKLTDALSARLSYIADKKFDFEKDIEQKFTKAGVKDTLLLEAMKNAVIGTESTKQIIPIDDATYVAATFGSLIFIVIGLYLSNISKLKVGTIELEKATTDTIATSLSLSISKPLILNLSVTQQTSMFRYQRLG